MRWGIVFRPAAGMVGLAALLLAASCSGDDWALSGPEREPRLVATRGFAPVVPAFPGGDGPSWSNPADPDAALSADEMDCRRELRRLDVRFQDLPPIDDGGACRVAAPVSMSAIGSVRMQPAATLTCAMALTVARWTRKELVPAARLRYFSGVKAIHQASSYSCRNIRGTGTASEHAKGNALDIARIELTGGKDIDVKKPGWFSFRQKGLLNEVRADGCEYFSTVLGPGYNADHKDHFHFDIKERRGGRSFCR